jgi:uncharacterized Fe-S center protein
MENKFSQLANVAAGQIAKACPVDAVHFLEHHDQIDATQCLMEV